MAPGFDAYARRMAYCGAVPKAFRRGTCCATSTTVPMQGSDATSARPQTAASHAEDCAVRCSAIAVANSGTRPRRLPTAEGARHDPQSVRLSRGRPTTQRLRSTRECYAFCDLGRATVLGRKNLVGVCREKFNRDASYLYITLIHGSWSSCSVNFRGHSNL